MKHAKKLLCLLLTLVMVVGMFPMSALAAEGMGNFKLSKTYADTFTDVSVDDWFYYNVKNAYEYGLMEGTSASTFNPNGNVTLAETITVAARLHAIYHAGKESFANSNPWYKTYVDYCMKNGIIEAAYSDYNMPATRAQFAVILAAALPNAALKEINDVDDNAVPDVDMDVDYAEAVYKLYRAGILTGNDAQGTFAPQSAIRRSEVAAIVSRMADSYLRESISLSGSGGSVIGLLPPFWGNEDDEPTAEETFVVTFHWEMGTQNDTETQIVQSGDCAEAPNEREYEGFGFAGWFADREEKNLNNYYQFSQPVTENMDLYARWIDLTDSDGDGLVLGLEMLYGSSDEKVDTDEDRLNDYLEVFLFGTNPVLADTDGNGVNDGNEDFDKDGFSNADEIGVYNTDPLEEDSDSDDLKDVEEVLVYGTDPLKEDTDGDGVNDGKEVELGTDPLAYDASFNVTVSSEENDDPVSASVEIELEGSQVKTLSVDKYDNDIYFPEEMPGYMGSAYDFSVEGSFDSAVISFSFDEQSLPADADPVIYYFDEERCMLEELPTTVSSGVASTTVTHFSKYILVDRTIHEDSFTWVDVWDADGTFNSVEVALVIDDSGSLGGYYAYDAENDCFAKGNDPKHLRLTAARNFVDHAGTTAKIGIVKFDGKVDVMSDLRECTASGKEALKKILKISPGPDGEGVYDNISGIFDSRGNTAMYAGIDAAFDLFSESTGEDDHVLRAMIVFTDGNADDAYMHYDIINEALEKEIRIYTVGLGSSTDYFSSYLRPLAQRTDGEFYLASVADKLVEIFDDISERIDLEFHSDNDDIPDYYEDNMVLFNGVNITLDKYKDDTDGDGVPDGEEVIIERIYSPDGKQCKVMGRIAVGDPTKPDSDDDGYRDDVDMNATYAYKTPVIFLHGWNGDTNECYGLETLATGNNANYNKETDNNGHLYTDCRTQQIGNVKKNTLGNYLINQKGYVKNGNVFAFNYANQDMVWKNAGRLANYIRNVIADGQDGIGVTGGNSCVDGDYLFATKEDKEAGKVKFTLIAHSMGGLVSRYYIENLSGAWRIDRLITIDTPHYGSSFADSLQLPVVNSVKWNPGAEDLTTYSKLFGGLGMLTLSIEDDAAVIYAKNNQSLALEGNKGLGVPYYAICGYDVNTVAEIDNLAEDLRDETFGFMLDRATSSKTAYKNSILSALDEFSRKFYGESSCVDLGDADGDNVVDHMSQLAIKFKGDKTVDYQILEKAAMIFEPAVVSNVVNNDYHNTILHDSYMWAFLYAFIID